MEEEWRVGDTAEYLCSRAFTVVAAQFPDELLAQAARVATLLQDECKRRGHAVQVYVLADTSYNSLSVDEVAASHVDAHCVVHYGRASLTRLSRLPAYFVFPRRELDPGAAAAALISSSVFADALKESRAPVVVLLDQPFLHQLPQLQAEMELRAGGARLIFADVPSRNLEPTSCGPAAAQPADGCCKRTNDSSAEATVPSTEGASSGCGCTAAPASAHASPAEARPAEPGEHSAAGYTWRFDPGDTISSCSFAWVGAPDAPALAQLQLTRSAAPWALFDPGSGALAEGLPPSVARTLRRRYYLVEKARNADVIGILVGTLGVAGYQGALDSLRAAARAAGKKTYTLLMGKPSPAKLANFPEIQVFVMVADPQGQILECKDYLAPIITPHEAMLAFTPGAEWDAAGYRLDFDGVLQGFSPPGAAGEEPRFSLLDGGYHGEEAERVSDHDGEVSALAVQAQQALMVTAAPPGGGHLVQPRSAADYFVHKRSWTGVEAPIVGAAPKAVEAAVPGRSGRAAGYVDEPSHSGSGA